MIRSTIYIHMHVTFHVIRSQQLLPIFRCTASSLIQLHNWWQPTSSHVFRELLLPRRLFLMLGRVRSHPDVDARIRCTRFFRAYTPSIAFSAGLKIEPGRSGWVICLARFRDNEWKWLAFQRSSWWIFLVAWWMFVWLFSGDALQRY